MSGADLALDFYRNNLGLGESPPGSNCNWITQQFYEQAGRPSGLAPGCYAWCAVTLSFALNTAFSGTVDLWSTPGVHSDYPCGTAYVPNLNAYFINSGYYNQTPAKGAVVFFGWSSGSDGDHVGMVESWVDTNGVQRTDPFNLSQSDGTIVTLEGNHNDSIIRMRRSMTLVIGYGHPAYSLIPDSSLESDDLSMIFYNQAGVGFYLNGGIAAVLTGEERAALVTGGVKEITYPMSEDFITTYYTGSR